jgi:phosphatidylserine/phosphatidylglycerophosphate/cardiolipin synthase-like enzyme
LLTSAQRVADLSSLTPPDGFFRAAIRNAITRLSRRANPPQVRLLFGTFPVQGVVNTTTQLKDMTRDVARSSPIDVALGAYRSSDLPPSWNHSKIVAVDGRDALVGGHNVWTKHYLSIDPVHDTSMRIRGSAAGDAQRFVNDMWKYTCDNMTWSTWLTWSVWVNQLKNGKIITACPKAYDLPTHEGPESTTVIAVGRLGVGIVKDANQSDVALAALMRSAKHTLRMSLQDFGPVKIPVVGVPFGGWPEKYIAEIARAIARGVHVHMVLSNLNASAGGLSPIEAQYANGWSPGDVGKQIRAYMESHQGFLRGQALTEQLCSRLHLAPFRYGSQASWSDGVPFANHDKVVIADAQGFYIGSQNLYPADLQEFGYIVDDSRVTGELLAQHWTHVWGHAASAAVSGDGAPRCEL